MKKFTSAALAENDGKEGRPALVAFRGKVFDVTESRLWKNGTHMNRHLAGNDLSDFIHAAPHEKDVLGRFPQTGVLIKESDLSTERIPSGLRFLAKSPFLYRHFHPMIVHFPIALIIMAVVFDLIFFASGISSFKLSALHCLGAGILFCIPAISTGFFSWLTNYGGRRMKAITMKILLSSILLIDSTAVFIWRICDPAIESSFQPEGIVYLTLFFFCVPLIALTGWYGGQLTFSK
ncbi:MAG: hypothetical protein M0P57_04590 [Syntrophales bacterium]|jgi:predicted heme/steroid binding protein/uncharacterized membrane protein|nr:hypothetical protein [Syntrophales bacterium]MDY0043438.1 cytochrome b5 domain-containing protein [Syntrophales bacterium]